MSKEIENLRAPIYQIVRCELKRSKRKWYNIQTKPELKNRPRIRLRAPIAEAFGKN